MPDACAHFARKVARENSSNDSVPSWFASSWSKILRASISCDGAALVDGAGFVDVSLCAPFVVGDEGGDVDDVGGMAVDGDMAGDGVDVAADVLAAGVDCASMAADALDDVGAAWSDVVAHAAPAIVMIAAAPAVATFISKEFIATLLSLGGGERRR